MAITLNGTTGISSPGGDTSTSLATTNLSYTGTLTGGTGVIAIGTNQIYKDASGNVGIGTASPSGKLHVVANLPGSLTLETTAASSDQTQITFKGTTGSKWAVGNNAATGGTGANFDFYDLAAGANRMRLDSSGNLLVGTTSAFGKLASQQTTSAVNFRADCNVASYTSTNIWSTFTNSGNNNTTAIHFAAYTGANVCVIYGNGNIQNTNNSYGSLSDIKLKENIVDATPKLEDLCKVKVRNFNLKGEQNHKQIGVVAQELEGIFPGLIEDVADRDEEGNLLGTTTKSVKYSVFVPMLVKAIQELTTRLEALEAQ